MFVEFVISEDLSVNPEETLSSLSTYISLVPKVEVYRYSDKAMVASLAADSEFATSTEAGVKTGLFADFDPTGMYLKFIAPSVRLTLTNDLYYTN